MQSRNLNALYSIIKKIHKEKNQKLFSLHSKNQIIYLNFEKFFFKIMNKELRNSW